MINSFFALPPNISPELKEKAAPVRALLFACAIGGFLVASLLTLLSFFLQGKAAYLDSVIITGFGLSLLSLLLLAVLKRGYVFQAAYIFVFCAFAAITFTIYARHGVTDPLIGSYFIFLVFLGLVFGSRAAIIFGSLAVVTVVVFFVAELSGWQSYPDGRSIALNIWLGAPFSIFIVTLLIRHFNNHLVQREKQLKATHVELQQLNLELDGRVQERTRALQLTIEVGRRLTSILDKDQLVAEVVELIRQSFDYYHVHMYQVDKSARRLILAGGSGEAGRVLLNQGHTLKFEQGIVGQVAQRHTPMLLPDVSQDDNWLPNPVLPETKAELAVPILLGDELLGVLDVQNDKKESLSQSDVTIMQAVANQIAVALRNARIISAIRQQAEHEAIVNELNLKLQTTNDIDSLLQIVAKELNEVLDIKETKIRIGPVH